jgi:hypothetical protein
MWLPGNLPLALSGKIEQAQGEWVSVNWKKLSSAEGHISDMFIASFQHSWCNSNIATRKKKKKRTETKVSAAKSDLKELDSEHEKLPKLLKMICLYLSFYILHKNKVYELKNLRKKTLEVYQ